MIGSRFNCSFLTGSDEKRCHLLRTIASSISGWAGTGSNARRIAETPWFWQQLAWTAVHSIVDGIGILEIVCDYGPKIFQIARQPNGK